MRRLHWIAAAAAVVLSVGLTGCGAQSPDGSGGAVEDLPPDPGLAYESEPDDWETAPGTADESVAGSDGGTYGEDSCRLHNGIAYGNYTRLTPYQVAVLAHRQGVACGTNLVRAVAISGAESSRYQYAYLVNTNCSLDRGLWQINSHYWPAYSGYSQATNAHGMYVISNHGTNWRPWVTYTTGAYRNYWSNACTAVRALCGFRPSGC